MAKEEFLKRHEAEHARVNRLKKAKGNVARDYWINMELQPFDMQWEKERRPTMKRSSRHAVGECYKTLNIHDPHDKHVWAKDVPLWKVVLGRMLAGAALLFGLWAITILGLLL